jgi:hypothetical protein
MASVHRSGNAQSNSTVYPTEDREGVMYSKKMGVII